jgi:predicted transcriptional regulator
MSTAKDAVRNLLDRLPEETTLEDIRYQIDVLDDISRGAEEIDRGEGIDHEQVKRRLARWLDE